LAASGSKSIDTGSTNTPPAASTTRASETATTEPDFGPYSRYENSVRAPPGRTTATGTTNPPTPNGSDHSNTVETDNARSTTSTNRPRDNRNTVTGATSCPTPRGPVTTTSDPEYDTPNAAPNGPTTPFNRNTPPTRNHDNRVT
jgi:hypothetical protein